jgi:hypothetical protein
MEATTMPMLYGDFEIKIYMTAVLAHYWEQK